jgi:simple sugar transport system permease protein
VHELLTTALVVSALHLATPLIFPALGGLISERSGVMNIGLEGMMLVGAFSGVLISYKVGNPWLGVLGAIGAGCLTGAVLALLCVTFHANQVVAATAINLVGAGATAALIPVVWGVDGTSPSVAKVGNVRVPLLADLPGLGPIFRGLTPLDYLALVAIVGVWWLLFRTETGLRLRACGESPQAADAAGVDVARVRWVAVVASGGFAALGGVYLSLAAVGLFQASMTQGRGYLALAAMIFGKWRTWPAAAACALFALADATQLRLQVIGASVPPELLQALPYLLAVVALATFVGRATAPGAVGKPYHRA